MKFLLKKKLAVLNLLLSKVSILNFICRIFSKLIANAENKGLFRKDISKLLAVDRNVIDGGDPIVDTDFGIVIVQILGEMFL